MPRKIDPPRLPSDFTRQVMLRLADRLDPPDEEATEAPRCKDRQGPAARNSQPVTARRGR